MSFSPSPKPFSVLSLKAVECLKSYIPVVFISGHAAHSLLTLFCILNVILIGLLLLFMCWTYTLYFYVNNVLACLKRGSAAMMVGDRCSRMIRVLFKRRRCLCGYSVMSNKWKCLTVADWEDERISF